MPVNTTHTTAAIVNIGAVGVAGSFLGIPAEALLLGLMGGAAMCALRPPDTRGRVIAVVMASMMFAGAFARPLAVAIIQFLPFFADARTELTAALALTVGAGWPKLGRLLEEILRDLWAQRFGGHRKGGSDE